MEKALLELLSIALVGLHKGTDDYDVDDQALLDVRCGLIGLGIDPDDLRRQATTIE